MANRNDYPSGPSAGLTVDHLDRRDEVVIQALVTAGALVALADGRVEAIERDELVDFIDRQGFVPSMSRHEIGLAFDTRVNELKDREISDVIAQSFRPLAGSPLASLVIRTATQVVAADRRLHPGEVRALKLLRQAVTTNPDPQPITS